jgi:hypothetical protein
MGFQVVPSSETHRASGEVGAADAPGMAPGSEPTAISESCTCVTDSMASAAGVAGRAPRNQWMPSDELQEAAVSTVGLGVAVGDGDAAPDEPGKAPAEPEAEGDLEDLVGLAVGLLDPEAEAVGEGEGEGEGEGVASSTDVRVWLPTATRPLP